jgi:replication factor C subunit 3/5
MFFIDKYRPYNKDDSSFHKEIINMLDIMSKDDAIPHVILYGPEGGGKKTLINIFLGMLFGKGVYNTKDVSYEITGSGGKKTTEKIKQSYYHITINPKNNNYDRYLIHDVVKKYAKTKSINSILEKNKPFKMVFINGLDSLSFFAQAALRRTMEKYNDKCRFVMWCNSLSKVIDPLQSRCVCIQVPAPSDVQLFEYMNKICITESIKLSLTDYSDIIRESNGNIKIALWELQFKKFGHSIEPEYKKSLYKLLDLLLECKLENMKEIRNIYFDSMITNFTGTNILRDFVNIIYDSRKISDQVLSNIVQKTSDIDCGLLKGRREIIHLDAFSIACMKYIADERKEQTKENSIKSK